MAAKIKICGLSRPEDISIVNEYKPDYAGFVFFNKSHRYVSVEQAVDLSRRLSPEIIPVGVFLDNTLEEIMEVEKSGAVQVLQLHGKTARELVKKLKENSALQIWEAVQINTANESPADMILLDNGPGGTGEKFDWSLINGIKRDFFLAGGLNAANVDEALKYKPYGVDVSSGVETNKIKDPDKIKEFIELVREKEK